MQTRINIAHEIARKNLKRKTQYQKRYYYAKSRIKKIIIRQPVLLPDQTMKAGKYHKLQIGRVLTLSWRKLIAFCTYLNPKTYTQGIPYRLTFTLYGSKSSEMGQITINKLGSCTCLNILCTFTCIVCSDVHMCRNWS